MECSFLYRHLTASFQSRLQYVFVGRYVSISCLGTSLLHNLPVRTILITVLCALIIVLGADDMKFRVFPTSSPQGTLICTQILDLQLREEINRSQELFVVWAYCDLLRKLCGGSGLVRLPRSKLKQAFMCRSFNYCVDLRDSEVSTSFTDCPDHTDRL